MTSKTRNWLSSELGSIEKDTDRWSVGLKASFDSLFEREEKAGRKSASANMEETENEMPREARSA